MWIDTKTQVIARTHSDIRAQRPNWSGPAVITDDMIAALGFVPVAPVAPVYDAVKQVANELPPKFVNGAWIQQWEVTDLSTTQIAANLGAAVAAKNAEINAQRLAMNFGTFTYAGKQIACDTLSRSDIDGANGYIALFGALPPDWVGGWKTVDNGYVAITSVDDWKAFFKAMYDQGSANFKRSQVLKIQLSRAATAADITAIAW